MYLGYSYALFYGVASYGTICYSILSIQKGFLCAYADKVLELYLVQQIQGSRTNTKSEAYETNGNYFPIRLTLWIRIFSQVCGLVVGIVGPIYCPLGYCGRVGVAGVL